MLNDVNLLIHILSVSLDLISILFQHDSINVGSLYRIDETYTRQMTLSTDFNCMLFDELNTKNVNKIINVNWLESESELRAFKFSNKHVHHIEMSRVASFHMASMVVIPFEESSRLFGP